MHRSSHEAGFTLLEALVASAIMVLVVTSFLGIRTAAMADAAEARNWRVAREKALQVLTEIQAGAREDTIDPSAIKGQEMPLPGMAKVDGWSYSIVIGESEIADMEGQIESASAVDSNRENERLQWQRDRDDYRKAKAQGMSFIEYQEKAQLQDEEEDYTQAPSEDEFEEVGVFVRFPNVRYVRGDSQPEFKHFVLKARISTLAITGLTPEEAEAQNKANGATEGAGAEGAAPGFEGTNR